MDEIHRIILETVNKDKIEQLDSVLSLQQQKILAVNEAFQQGAISQQAFEAATVAAGTRMAAVNAQIDSLKASTRDFSQSGLRLSYVIDDLTNTTGGWERKIAAIGNNLPGLVMSLGGTAGIAGAIGIIGSAAIAATPLVKALIAAFTGTEGLPGVKLLLDDATERVKGLQAELDKLMKSRPMEEKTTAADVEFLIGEEGAEKLVRQIAAGMGASGEGAQMTGAEKQRLKNLRGALGGTDDERVNTAIRNAQFEISKRITAENERMAGEMLASAPTSAGTRKRIGKYLPKFGEALASTEPEARNAADAWADEQIKAAEESGKAAGRAVKKRLAEAKKRTEANIKRNAQAVREFKQFGGPLPPRKPKPPPRLRAVGAGDGIKGMLERMRQKQAADLEANIIRQGGAMFDPLKRGQIVTRPDGMTPRQAAQLQQLQEKLGKDMPTLTEINQIMIASQNNFVFASATLQQQLAEVRRINARTEEMTRQMNQFGINGRD
jgi:hypothetical protein